jgi:anti-sigma B factor antagonist
MEAIQPQPFTIDVQRQEMRCILRLCGELDMAAVPTCDEALHSLQHEEASEVVIDLRGLTFLDSTGLSALVQAHLAGKDGHRSVSFVRGDRAVHRVFELTKMDVFLDWTDPPN